MALSASRPPKGRKGIPDNAPPNRKPAWKTQSPFAPPAANRTSTPPAAATGPQTSPTPPATSPTPTDSKPSETPVPHANGNGNGASPDSFRTDTEISHASNAAAPRPRELQAWQADPAIIVSHQPSASLGGGRGDDITFGLGSSNTGSGSWDQFAANEQLFGVTASFDEDVYTTKLDRSSSDYKERERKAQIIANEIMGSSTSNPHLAEERGQVDDSGVGEEDKYGAVVRSTNAYVPPGARKNLAQVVAGAASPSPPPINGAKPDTPKPGKLDTASATSTTTTPPALDSVVGNFRDFVSAEKQRLQQKRQLIHKSEFDKRINDLVSFSKSFKLNRPIPEDLVPILAKDEAKQNAIREKATADATAGGARAIGPSSSNPSTGTGTAVQSPALKPSATTNNLPVAVPLAASQTTQRLAAKKPSATAPAASPTPAPAKPGTSAAKKPVMFIPKIPPFNPNKPRPTEPASATGAAPANNAQPAAPASPGGDQASRLNANAPSFRPGGTGSNAPPSKTGSPINPPATSPKAKPLEATSPPATQPNPFFGTRPVKKAAPVHIKDDFNPFKFAKVAEASAVAAVWPYNGKRFMLMYPAPPPAPTPPAVQPQPVHVAPVPGMQPPPVPQPATGYEDEQNRAAAAAQAAPYPVIYYSQYAYPGQYQPPPQHVMPGAPQPPPGYIHGFIPHMPYPPPMHNGHPPPAMYPQPMPGMPPPQGFIPPPPPGYPAPGGAPGSMPPTPMPAHAYYHPSPQLAHAVPYQMMMAPPVPQQQQQPGQQRPPHHYDGQPPQGPPGPPAHQ